MPASAKFWSRRRKAASEAAAVSGNSLRSFHGKTISPLVQSR
jgi:hypothetical protein